MPVELFLHIDTGVKLIGDAIQANQRITYKLNKDIFLSNNAVLYQLFKILFILTQNKQKYKVELVYKNRNYSRINQHCIDHVDKNSKRSRTSKVSSSCLCLSVHGKD